MLVEAKADVHARDIELANTPLHEAVSKNRGGIAQLLLMHRADPASINARKQDVNEVCASVQMRDMIQEAIIKQRREEDFRQMFGTVQTWTIGWQPQSEMAVAACGVIGGAVISKPAQTAKTKKRSKGKGKGKLLLAWG